MKQNTDYGLHIKVSTNERKITITKTGLIYYSFENEISLCSNSSDSA